MATPGKTDYLPSAVLMSSGPVCGKSRCRKPIACLKTACCVRSVDTTM